MSDPVSILISMTCLFLAAAAVRFFKSMESDFWQAVRTPVFAGLAAGFLVRLIGGGAATRSVAIGVTLTAAALYARLTGEESEPVDGMLPGTLTGAAAALPLALTSQQALLTFAACVLAGAVAGYGVTFAAFHVADKLRQLVLDVITAAAAVGAANVPAAIARAGIPESRIAISATALVPLLLVITVFKQWPDVRAELRHEASLGFIEDADVRATAHPFLKFGRGGWADGGAHREFVKVANRLALRKRQQRNRTEDRARLYQLEIIKLRMQLQEMSSIDDATLRHHRDVAEGSDTMADQ